MSSEKAPLSERTPPPRSPRAPPAPRGPQRPALQTPGLKEPGASGERRTQGGRRLTRPRSLSGFGRRQEGGGGGGVERAQKVRAGLPRQCSRITAARRGRGAGEGAWGWEGAGSWGERTGAPGEPRRAPPREADRSLRANKGPLCQLLPIRPRVPEVGALGDPRRRGLGRAHRSRSRTDSLPNFGVLRRKNWLATQMLSEAMRVYSPWSVPALGITFQVHRLVK